MPPWRDKLAEYERKPGLLYQLSKLAETMCAPFWWSLQEDPETIPDSSRGESAHRFPSFLPDGRHFLYLAFPSNTIWVASLDGKDTKRLVNADSQAQYAPPGYLLFARQGTLMAQPFDAGRATSRFVHASPGSLSVSTARDPVKRRLFRPLSEPANAPLSRSFDEWRVLVGHGPCCWQLRKSRAFGGAISRVERRHHEVPVVCQK